MKKIKLISIKEPNKDSVYMKHKLYSVYLGNGHLEYFTAKSEAKKYLNRASRFLNFKMFEINQSIMDLYAMYRSEWFKFYDGAKSSNYLRMESEIRTKIEMAEDMLNRSWQKSQLINGNHFAFDFLYKSLEFLDQSSVELQAFCKAKYLVDKVQQIEVIRVRLSNIQYALAHYTGLETQQLQKNDEINYEMLKLA